MSKFSHFVIWRVMQCYLSNDLDKVNYSWRLENAKILWKYYSKSQCKEKTWKEALWNLTSRVTLCPTLLRTRPYIIVIQWTRNNHIVLNQLNMLFAHNCSVSVFLWGVNRRKKYNLGYHQENLSCLFELT